MKLDRTWYRGPTRQFSAGWRFTGSVVVSLLAASIAAAAQDERAIPEHLIESLSSDRAEIGWTLRAGQPPITSVELWYTDDGAASWKRASSISPAAMDARRAFFTPPADGVFGLYLVLGNATARTPVPSVGASAHKWVRFDRALPEVKFLTARASPDFDLTREIELRWQVDDASLPDRPVTIHYRAASDGAFQPVEQHQHASGSLRWTVPAGEFDKLTVKITAVDRAGNRGHASRLIGLTGPLASEVQQLPAVSEAPAAHPSVPSRSNQPISTPEESPDISQPVALARLAAFTEPDAGESHGDSAAAKEAARLYDLATWHRLRGEYDIAIARYRDALEQVPLLHRARVDLAGVLILLGDHAGAEAEYQRVLDAEPRDRAALKGLALVQARERRYRSAHASMQKLLLLEPEDAEAWLHFGDVCIFIGDRPAAREAWQRAASIEAAGVELRRRAERRLASYSARLGQDF